MSEVDPEGKDFAFTIIYTVLSENCNYMFYKQKPTL